MAGGDRDAYHPDPANLERLLLGEMTPRQAAPLVAHLIRGCGRCRVEMGPLAAVMFSAGREQPEPVEEADSKYDFPLFKAFAAARRYAQKTRGGSPAGPGSLHLQEAAAPEPLSREDKTARDRTRCEALLAQCRTLRSTDPERMVLTAEFAVKLAEHLECGSEEQPALSDLRARAWAELGNAHRIADDLATAESDLAQALKRAGEGTGDPLVLARLMHLTASLFTDQRRFQEACHLLDAAYTVYEREGDTHSAALTLIGKGLSAGYAFDVEEAIQYLVQGLSLLEGGREPKLVQVAVHNLIWCLVESGRPELAESLFQESRSLFGHPMDGLDAVKTEWLEGRIAAGLQDSERAEQQFVWARARFVEAALPYEVALVSLDMAVLWLRAGRTADIADLLDQTIGIFQTRGICREATSMLLILREAFRRDQATEALVRKVATELLRLEDVPARYSEVRG